MYRVRGVLLLPRMIFSYLLPLIMLVNCGQVEDQEKGFETIAQGIISGITSERLEAIRDQDKWREFWKSHIGADSELPSINFVSETVIVVHLGTKPSAPQMNAAVNITEVENQPGILVVHYDEVVPSSGCRNQEMFSSQPHHIIKIRRNDGEPTFIRSEQKRACI